MSAPFTPVAAKPLSALPAKERMEARFGRTHWTVEDYLAEGRREFDREFIDTGKASPWQPGNREAYARAFVDFHCPKAKLVAALAGGSF